MHYIYTAYARDATLVTVGDIAYGARHYAVVYGFLYEIMSTDAVTGEFRIRQDYSRDTDGNRRSTAVGRPHRNAVPCVISAGFSKYIKVSFLNLRPFALPPSHGNARVLRKPHLFCFPRVMKCWVYWVRVPTEWSTWRNVATTTWKSRSKW